MTIRFDHLVATNFMAIEAMSFQFQEDHNPLGLCLITGKNLDAPKADSNGAGKSTLLEALAWCLWGKTFRGLSNAALVQSHKKKMEVYLHFEVAGIPYTLFRSFDGSTSLELHAGEGGEEITKTSIAKTQAVVDNLLGLSFSSFAAMTPGAVTQIGALTDSKIKEIIENVLETDFMGEARKLAKTSYDLLVKDCADALHQLDLLETDLAHKLNLDKTLQDKLASFKHQKTQLTASLDKIQAEKAYTIQELEKSKKKIQVKLKALSKTADELQDLEAKVTQLSSEIQTRKEKYQKFKDDINEKAAGWSKEKFLHLKPLKTLNDMSTCPTCQSEITEEHKQQLIQKSQKSAASLDKKIAGAQKLLKEFQEFTTHEVTKLSLEKAAVVAKLDEAAKISKKCKLLQVEKEKLQYQIDMHKNSKVEDDYQKQLSTLSTYILNTEGDLHSLYAKIKMLKDKITELKDDLELWQSERDTYQYWVQGFSYKGLRGKLLYAAIPFLNARLKHYTNVLTGGDLQIAFNTQKQQKKKVVSELHVDCKLKHGSQNYAGLSKGEKARADICISLAIGDLAMSRATKKFPIRFLDEAFDGLDTTGFHAVAELLQEMSGQFDTILVTSHNNEMKSLFNKQIQMTKKDGKVHMELLYA